MVNFILIVACFARTFCAVARVLLFAELSGFDERAALDRAHVGSAKRGCARLVAHTAAGGQ